MTKLSKPYRINNSDWTVSLWFKPHRLIDGRDFLFNLHENYDLARAWLQNSNQGETQLYVEVTHPYIKNSKNNGKRSAFRFKLGKIQLDSWYQITITFEFRNGNRTTTLYVNGTQYDSITLKDTPNLQGLDLNYVAIGQEVDGEKVKDASNTFIGAITEFYFYNIVLSTDDVIEMFNHRPSVDNRILSWSQFSNYGKGNKDIVKMSPPY